WVSRNVAKDQQKFWKLNHPQPLTKAEVSFPALDPAATGTDRPLVLAEVTEINGKYTVVTKFNSAKYGLPLVRGRLYAANYSPGLWMYYAQPNNLESVLAGIYRDYIRNDVRIADEVQRDVVEALLKGPEQASKLRKGAPVSTSEPLTLRRVS